MASGNGPVSWLRDLSPGTVILIILLGSVSGGGAGTALFSRPDALTGKDGAYLRGELLAEVARVRAECDTNRRFLEAEIRRDMPPSKTRERILGIERHLWKRDQYEPPTNLFNAREQ